MVVRPSLVLCLFLTASAVAQPAGISLPERRPGHWELTMLLEGVAGGPEIKAETCTDAATERQMMQFALGMAGGSCQRYEVRRAGQDYHVEVDCQMGPMRTVSRSVMSGDFQTTYSIRIEGSLTMPGQPPQQTLLVQNARWRGATCSGGLVPGDIQTAGNKVNILRLGAAGAPSPRP
ncbi:MAG: DUF3617 domain-containing protein [Phreatobacter sp.]|nr:DUF3617 domain-containing protein [Phreatobacter sp.]